MTVKELIEKLQNMPPGWEVKVCDREEWDIPAGIKELRSVHQYDANYHDTEWVEIEI